MINVNIYILIMSIYYINTFVGKWNRLWISIQHFLALVSFSKIIALIFQSVSVWIGNCLQTRSFSLHVWQIYYIYFMNTLYCTRPRAFYLLSAAEWLHVSSTYLSTYLYTRVTLVMCVYTSLVLYTPLLFPAVCTLTFCKVRHTDSWCCLKPSHVVLCTAVWSPCIHICFTCWAYQYHLMPSFRD